MTSSFSHLRAVLLFLIAALFSQTLAAQHSVVRVWSEVLLKTMEEDLARPHVQARNIFHFSIAMYDAWAAYDDEASTYLLGKQGACPCKNLPKPADVEAARREAMSFAAYRFMMARFVKSPQASTAVDRLRQTLTSQGYDFRLYSSDYTGGSPAALGNYIAQCVLDMGRQDGANEENNYLDPTFTPLNPPLEAIQPGVGKGVDPNQWQALKLNVAIDHDGYPVAECTCLGRRFSTLLDSVDENGRRRFTGTQTFQGTDWGRVKPFALKAQDRKTYRRNNHNFFLYRDPGADFLPKLDTLKGGSEAFLWNYSLVAAWSALLNHNDTTRWDISPRSMGNVPEYPGNLAELPNFYNLQTGRDPGNGYTVNPRTGQPYTSKPTARADFIRTAVQYWAEGPHGETAPGHWLTLLHYASDQPGLVKKFNGKGRQLSDLEWDVKSLFVLGGALHDAAVTTWGIKGWYETARPITALRYLAALGQSSNPQGPSYHPAGIPLIPGRIELVKKGDPLISARQARVGDIKFYAWKGPFKIKDPFSETAGVGWIAGKDWYPYQPKTFLSPAFPGFVSEHAAFSHAAAEALTLLTGDAYFPGGLGEATWVIDSTMPNIEKVRRQEEIVLQWATYRDAADQASLSRVWGGLNTPFDDIPGRRLGRETGAAAFQLAKNYFYKDNDRDGYRSYEDCDDKNAGVHPGAVEACDGLDNDCNGQVDDTTPPCGGGG